MRDYDRDVSREVAAVFVDGYEKDLIFLSKNREHLIDAFRKMICPDVFYAAELDGEIVGILACSNNKNRALTIDKTIMRNAFGFVKGGFNNPLPYGDDTGYVEGVATTVRARGKGVSTSLMKYVLEHADYKRYTLEVTDANEVAYGLYKKLDYTEYNRIKENFSKYKEFKYRIYMESIP